MKKILSLCLFMAFSIFSYAQEEPAPKLFPVVDGKVMYEKIVDAPGTTQTGTDLKVIQWMSDNLKDASTVSHSPEIGQLIYQAKIYVDIYTVDFKIQTDAKDGKFRIRIFDIKTTVTGKENTVLFAKYIVNVPAESDNAIVKGEVKGYGKGQRNTIKQKISDIDVACNRIMSSMQNFIFQAPKKAEEF